jgi:RND family efflux transporter MFP subunit
MPDHPDVLNRDTQRWLRPTLVVGLGVFLIILALGIMTRVRATQALHSWTAAQAVPSVEVISPTAPNTSQTLVLPGAIQAFNVAQIHARVSGYLKRWTQDIGARVKTGQTLAEIDTPELDQQLAQARANLATAVSNQGLARSTAARWTSLLTQDAVSRQEAEERQADLAAKTSLVNAAEAEVRRLTALEAFKRIAAPFDGIVTARTTDIGALIAAGTPNDPGLFTVADDHRLRLYVRAPQSYSADFHPGDRATFTVPEYPGRTFSALLTSTTGAVSDQSGTMLIELQIDNTGRELKPGDYAQVRFALPSRAGTIVLPASALMFRHQGMAVATVGPGDRVVMKPVTIAVDRGATVEIASGLATTDRVIDNPPDSLNRGDRVRIAPAPRAAT